MSYPTIELPDFAFTGKAGAGKTTGAEVLELLANYHRMPIAQPLKDIAVEIWGPGSEKDRSKLQPLGQSVRAIDEDAWMNLLLRRMDNARHASTHTKRFAVDDLRFPNEYWKLKEAGFVVVRVTAPRLTRIDRLKNIGKFQTEEQLDDLSEIALDDYEADYEIANDGTPDEFFEAVRELVQKERARV